MAILRYKLNALATHYVTVDPIVIMVQFKKLPTVDTAEEPHMLMLIPSVLEMKRKTSRYAIMTAQKPAVCKYFLCI